MAESIFELVGKVILDGADAVKNQLSDLDQKADKASGGITSKFSKIGPAVAIGAGAAIGAIGGIGAAALAIGGNFDDAYDKIRGSTGKTGTALDGLEQDFKTVVSNVPTDFDSASTAVSELNKRLGLTGQPLVDLSTQFINLSELTGTDLTSAIESGTKVFGAWNIATGDQATSMDFLYKTSQQTGVGIGDLMGGIQKFAPQLQQFGFSFEDSATLLGNWQQKGIDANQMLAGMSIGLATLSKNGVKDTHAGLEQVIADIQGAGSDADATSIAIQTFGTRAGPAMATNIRKGALSINDLEAAIKSSSDTINGAKEDTEDFAEKWQLFKNRAMVALEPVANAVFGLGGTLLDNLGPALGTVFSWMAVIAGLVGDKLSPTIDFLSVKFGQIATFLEGDGVAAFKSLADAVQSFMDKISPVTDFLKDNWQSVIAGFVAIILTIVVPAFYAWATAAYASATATIAALSPIILILAAIGLAAAALFYAWQHNFLGIQDLVSTAFSFITSQIGPFIAFIQGTLLPLFQQLVAYLQTEFAPIWTELGPTIASLQAYFQGLSDAIERIITYLFSSVIQPTFQTIAAFLQDHSDQINKVLGDAWTAIQVLVQTTVDIISQIIQLAMNLIQGDWQGAWNNIKQIVQDVWDLIKALVQLAVDALKLELQLAWDAIKLAAQVAWTGIKDLVNGIATNLKDLVAGVFNTLKTVIDGIWQAHVDAARTAWQFLSDTVMGIVNPLKDAILNAFGFARDTLSGIWTEIYNTANTAWTNFKTLVTGFVTDTKNSITGTFTDAKTTLDGIWTDITTAASTGWGNVKKIFTDGKQDMQDAALAPFNYFKDNVQSVVSGAWGKIKIELNNIIGGFEYIQHKFVDALNWIFSNLGLGQPFSYLNLPGLAQGTDYAKGGLYQLAERGAELVWMPGAGWTLVKSPTEMFLPPGSKVLPAGRSKGILNNSKPLTMGRGNFVGDVIDTVGDIASSVVDTAKDWAEKGTDWVINKALDSVGTNFSLPGALGNAASGIVSFVKNGIKDAITELIKGINDKAQQQQAQAPVQGTDGVAYTGNNAVVKEAFTQLGQTMSGNYDSANGNHPWDMYCEAFVEAVGQHVGYARHFYGSAQNHADSISLRGGTAPAGASAFWHWDTDGHVSIAIGDGTYIGTSGSGVTVQGPGGPYLGWAPPGVANGGFFPGGNPTPVIIGEGAHDEIVAPVPMLQQIIGEALDMREKMLQLRNDGVAVNFNGPVTIQAQDQLQAERSAQDIGWATKQSLRARGLA